jgi:hypothetical protein
MANKSKVLLVEGKQDLMVIAYLMEANGVPWTKNNEPVWIKDCDVYENLVKQLSDPDVILTELKASRFSALGIMIDADDKPEERWQSIRNASLQSITGIPEALPEDGLIHTTDTGIRFGIWLMPDNRIRGMLETFLTYMIPTNHEPLWEFAQAVTKEAKSKGAAFIDPHLDKANIYTWLAWQDTPGQQLHQAVEQRIFHPTHPNAQRFVTWFKTLYEL